MEIEDLHSVASQVPNPKVKKITELTRDFARYQFYTDENGVRYRAPVELTVYREVQSASHNQRTINLLVDSSIILFIAYLISQILSILSPFFNLNYNQSSSLILLIPIVFFAYYYLFEFYQQQTVGKFLTQTILIDQYANRPTKKQILWRTFYRIPAFRLIHYYFNEYMQGTKFCHGYHDRKTTTWVVPLQELNELKKPQREK